MRPLVVLSLVSVGNASLAVVGTTSKTDPNPPDSFFTFVGKMNGASAVAVGPRAVLTARHVGSGAFTLGGTTYDVYDRHFAPDMVNPTTGATSTVDLLVVHLKSVLPGYYDLAPAIANGDALTMVGFGGSGVVDANGDKYNITVGGGTRRAAENVMDGRQFFDGFGPTLLSNLRDAGDAALVGGDSGGGWFTGSSGNLLAGISVFIDNQTVQHQGESAVYPDYGFASRNTNGYKDPDSDFSIAAGEPYFRSGAVDLTNPTLREFVVTQAVPEPASMLALAAGIGGLALRRGRSPKSRATKARSATRPE